MVKPAGKNLHQPQEPRLPRPNLLLHFSIVRMQRRQRGKGEAAGGLMKPKCGLFEAEAIVGDVPLHI